MHEFIELIAEVLRNLGYIGIFIMMTIEATFIPFPSEIALIPAGYLVSKGEMNALIVTIVASFGVIAGSLINYVIGYYLGEKVIKRYIHIYGKYIFLNESGLEKAEKYFLKHGDITTFTGRFIPGIRSFISFPPGIFKTSISRFLVFTGISAMIGNSILIGIGYLAGENEELIAKYSQESLIGVLVVISIIIVIYTVIHKYKKK